MPCRSDYMAPSRAEENSKEVAQHLVYVQTKLGHTPDNDYVEAARSIYGNIRKLEEYTQDLCQILGTLEATDKVELERIVYNAKDPKSRKLADWWEEHKAADKRRLDRERRAAEEAREREYTEYLRLKEKFGE